MCNWRVALIVIALITISSPCIAAGKYIEVDTNECGSDTPAKVTTAKSDLFTDKVSGIRAYGSVSYLRLQANAGGNHCHVIYKLFVAASGQQFKLVKQLDWDADDGQIAAIELIGLSPDRTKFAASFIIAEGDGQLHGPVVYDLKTKTINYLALEDKIQKRIHGCDQNEDFIGVTNAGEAVFAIPPSEYDDTPECGDKGIWNFNLKTGRVYRVAKISGDKWQ
jgi:hypothetical protein